MFHETIDGGLRQPMRIGMPFARSFTTELKDKSGKGAPHGFFSRVCFGCVFSMQESVGVDSALSRVAFLDTDLVPFRVCMVTVALLFNFFHFSHVCLLEVVRVSEAFLYWR